MDINCPNMQMFGIKTPIIKSGDDILKAVGAGFENARIIPQDNDILILAESAVATAEHRMIKLSDVKSSEMAKEYAQKYEIDPREMELILQECDEIIGGVPGAVLTITRGNLSPNAGIDSSNAPDGYVILLPENAQKSAESIREGINKQFFCNLGVIIGDSRTQPMRLGCVGIALGTSGIVPVEDARGCRDLYGKSLNITHKATADNLVSAAQIIMGEAGECTPAILVRGAPVDIVNESVEMHLFSRNECMYYSNISKNNKSLSKCQ
ncbi:coenzyme F420-0:L-glutamate ligase [Methanohalobium sp.]|uniref:coenzyme F420-0:L-glutamate ligase n=1 Tax=Methanohalobium sp. TaxID=2837493 RepID=UPI0025F0177C|nr:coenzyme F420-0:L-glutamate ligase [Methanohalobium sp.]